MNEEEISEIAKADLVPPLDSIFGSPTRLAIMLILFSYKRISFTELQKVLKISSGKLNHHFKKLEDERCVSIQKTFRNLRPYTIIKITNHGEDSFREYVDKLKDVLNKIP